MRDIGIHSQKGRQELKHALNQMDCYLLRNKMKHFMESDPNTNDDGKYVIRSVYFDNIDNKVYTEKKEGFYKRDKYRFRMYNMNTEYINLEKKSKRNNVTFKEKCTVNASEYEKIRFGDIEWMEQDSRPLVQELYVQMKLMLLKPITIVDYEREVFIYPHGNVRVTFDSHIRTSNRSIDFLNPDIHMVPALDPNIVILEVKYDEFIPDFIKSILQVSDRRKDTYSKYYLSRIYG